MKNRMVYTCSNAKYGFVDTVRILIKRPRCTCASRVDVKTGKHYLSCAVFARWKVKR